MDKIARILVSLSDGKNSVTDIAHQCNLSTSATHRLLNVLAESSFAVRDPINHKYYLGPLINNLTIKGHTTHQYLLTSIQPELEHLHMITEETIDLRLLVGLNILSIYENLSKQKLLVRISDEDFASRYSLLPFSASHIVLLSQLDEKKLKSTLNHIGLLYNHVFDTDLLNSQLEMVKRDGYYISHGVRVKEILGISAPIYNYTFPIALTIMGPADRMLDKLSLLKKMILNASTKLTTLLEHLMQNQVDN